MAGARARLSTTALYVVVSVLFWVPLAGGIFGIPASVATMIGSPKPLAIHAVIPAGALGGVPVGIDLVDPVPVRIPIGHVTPEQVVTYHVAIVLAAAAYLYGAWQLRQLVRSIRENDAFVPSNVRRLRVLAALVLLGYPLFQWVTGLLNEWMLSTAGPADTVARVRVELLSFPVMLAGLCLLVLAEIFTSGIALREDVEATT